MKSDAERIETVETAPLTGDIGCVAQPIIRAAQEAWGRLSAFQTYDDWMIIGEALLIGRNEALRAAQTDRPQGRHYNEAFSNWLKEHKLDGIDKGARSRLLKCIEHREEIEIWRAAQPMSEKLKLNHPETILCHWQQSNVVKPAGEPKMSAMAKWKASVIDLEEKNTALEEKISHMQPEHGDGDDDLWMDTAEDIARVILSKVSPSKAMAIADKLLHLVQLSAGKPNAQVH